MTKEQRQVILGTLLGKSFIVGLKGRNCFLTIPESLDINWLNYKANIINDNKKTFIKENKRFIWRSKCDKYWNNIQNEFYESGKKTVKMSILDELRNDGMATWFLDKGKFIKKRVCLGTTAFGLEGNKTIAQFFNEVGIPCEIWPQRNTAKILFSEYGTKVFINTIVRAIPKFMYYRVELL